MDVYKPIAPRSEGRKAVWKDKVRRNGETIRQCSLWEVKEFYVLNQRTRYGGKRAECARTEGDAREGEEKVVPLGQKVLPDFKKHLLSSTIGKTE